MINYKLLHYFPEGKNNACPEQKCRLSCNERGCNFVHAHEEELKSLPKSEPLILQAQVSPNDVWQFDKVSQVIISRHSLIIASAISILISRASLTRPIKVRRRRPEICSVECVSIFALRNSSFRKSNPLVTRSLMLAQSGSGSAEEGSYRVTRKNCENLVLT